MGFPVFGGDVLAQLHGREPESIFIPARIEVPDVFIIIVKQHFGAIKGEGHRIDVLVKPKHGSDGHGKGPLPVHLLNEERFIEERLLGDKGHPVAIP